MIRIQWSATSVERDDVAGGDSVVMDFSELLIDATLSESHEFGAIATEHSVENDVNITDHVHPQLRKITLECVVSNHVINTDLLSGSLRTAQINIPAKRVILGGATPSKAGRNAIQEQSISSLVTLQFDEEVDRVKETIARLDELIAKRTRVDILGLRFGDLYDWIITGLAPIAEAFDGVKFTLSAQELKTASISRVVAPRPLIERARQRQQNGRQGTTATSSETGQNRELSSALRDRYDERADSAWGRARGWVQLPGVNP